MWLHLSWFCEFRWLPASTVPSVTSAQVPSVTSALDRGCDCPRVVAKGVMRVSGLMHQHYVDILGQLGCKGICGAWLALSTFSNKYTHLARPGQLIQPLPHTSRQSPPVCRVVCVFHTRLGRLRACVLCLGHCLIVCHPAHASCFLLHAVMAVCLRCR